MKTKFIILLMLEFFAVISAFAQPVAVKDSFVVYGSQSIINIDPRINDYDPEGDHFIICDVRNMPGLRKVNFNDSCIPVTWYWESFLQYRICKANDTSSISAWTDLYVNRQYDEFSPIGYFDEVIISPFDSVWIDLTANDVSFTGNDLVVGSEGILTYGLSGGFDDNNEGLALLNYQFDEPEILNKDTLFYYYKLYDSIYDVHRPNDYGLLRVILTNNHWYDQLDVNNVSARFNCRGNHFWDMSGERMFYYPKGTLTTASFVQAIWVGGLEINGNDTIVHSSGEKNSSINVHFNIGPISTEYTVENMQRWFRTWKLDKEDVEYHRSHWWLPGYEMHESIATWPGNGNPELGQADLLAPFEDLNQNGRYEPQLGEFPKIRGDQSIFFIFNDENDKRSEEVKNYLGFEFQGMAYGYKDSSNDALMNTVFLHYDIINRSEIDYYDAYIGNFNDADIGYAFDDFIGSNVEGAYFYFFNGNNIDGYGQPYAYGENSPVFASKFLRGPLIDSDGIDNPDNQCDESVNGLFFGDGVVDNERYGMTSFMIMEGNNTALGIPETNLEFYNFLRARWRNNTHLEYGASGYSGYGTPSGVEAKFMFPDPDSDSCRWNTNGVDLGIWTEISENNPAYNRRGISAAGPFTFPAGSTQSIDLAFIVAPPLDSIPQSIETLKMYSKVFTSLIESNDSIFELSEYTPTLEDDHILIYPNPSSNIFYIDLHQIKTESMFWLYDINGRLIQSGFFKSQCTNELNLSQYAPNLYFLSMYVDGKYRTYRLSKME